MPGLSGAGGLETGGRNSVGLLEDPRKVIRVGKAYLRGDFLHRIMSPDEMRGGLVHFQACQHLVGAFPDKTIKETGEIGRVQMGQSGQFRDRLDGAKVLLQLSPATLETLPGAA